MNTSFSTSAFFQQIEDEFQCRQDMFCFNSSRPGQNGHLFADNIFRCILINEKFCILIKISPKLVPKGPIDNNPALV